MTLYAFPFGENRFEGDDQFYPCLDQVVEHDGREFSELLEAFATKSVKDGFTDPEDEEGLRDSILGFWIFDLDAMRAASAVWPEYGAGSDTETYALNRACKRVLDHLSVKTVSRV